MQSGARADCEWRHAALGACGYGRARAVAVGN